VWKVEGNFFRGHTTSPQLDDSAHRSPGTFDNRFSAEDFRTQNDITVGCVRHRDSRISTSSRTCSSVGLGQPFPLFERDVRLIENTAYGSDRHLMLVRHDSRIYGVTNTAYELHMAALLTDFGKTCPFQSALDFAKRFRLKPPQRQPRRSVRLVDVLPVAARSATPAPP